MDPPPNRTLRIYAWLSIRKHNTNQPDTIGPAFQNSPLFSVSLDAFYRLFFSSHSREPLRCQPTDYSHNQTDWCGSVDANVAGTGRQEGLTRRPSSSDRNRTTRVVEIFLVASACVVSSTSPRCRHHWHCSRYCTRTVRHCLGSCLFAPLIVMNWNSAARWTG